MAGNGKGQRRRHPNAAGCLEGLTEGEAAVRPPAVRGHGGGFRRYWLEGGEIQSRGITEDGLPLAGFRPDSVPLPALPAAVPAEFGPQLPKLAVDLASGVPDLDGVEQALRDAALGGGAGALKPLPERPGAALPPPECGECGKPMSLHRTGSRRAWLTLPSRIGGRRRRFRCRPCGKGRFPLDRAPGLEGSAFTPGMAGVMAGTVGCLTGGAAAPSGGRKAASVPGMFHAFECADGAVKAVLPDGAERDWRLKEARTDIRAGRAGRPSPYAAGTERRRRAAAALGTASGGCAAAGAAARACRPEAASWKAAAAGSGSG